MIDDQPSTPETDPPEKAILICPDCGHENNIDGDWVVHTEHERQVYDCPNCGAAITERYESRQVIVH